MRGLVFSAVFAGLLVFVSPVFAERGSYERDDGRGVDDAEEKIEEPRPGEKAEEEEERAEPEVEADFEVEERTVEVAADEEQGVEDVEREDEAAERVLDSSRGERSRERMRHRRMRREKRRERRREMQRFTKKSPFILKKGDYSLEVRAQLQLQAVVYVGKDALFENNDPATNEGVLIRRARFGMQGGLPWDLRYRFMLEAFGDVQRGSKGEGLPGQYMGAQILDMSMSWERFREFTISLGSHKVPGPKGRMISSSMLQLVERPIVIDALAVDRRAGAWIGGELKYFNYQAGVYNGDDGFSFGNETGGYMAAARLELTPTGHMGDGFSDYTSPFSTRFLQPRFSAGVSFQYSSGPATDRISVSGDAGFKWRGLSIAAEAVYEREEPIEKPAVPSAFPDVIESMGVYAQAGYFVLPARLEVAARFEYLDVNFDIDDSRDIWALTGGLNYYWSRYLRAQLSYTHKQELRYRQLQNDALLVQVQMAF